MEEHERAILIRAAEISRDWEISQAVVRANLTASEIINSTSERAWSEYRETIRRLGETPR